MKKKVLLVMLSALVLVSYTNVFADGLFDGVKFDPYATIKVYEGYHSLDANEANTNVSQTTPASSPTGLNTGGGSKTDFDDKLQLNSRFGANFAVDNMTATVEFGFPSNIVNGSGTAYNSGSGSNTYTNGALVLRLAYFTAKWGDFQVEAGQDWTPYTWLAQGDFVDDNNLTGFGASYDGRNPQLKFSYMGAYVDFIAESRTTGKYIPSPADTKAYMPKIAIGYDFKMDNTVVGLGYAINQVKIHDDVTAAINTDGLNGKSITSYIAFVHANIALADFVLRGNFAYLQNPGNFGEKDTTGNSNDTIEWTFAGKAMFKNEGVAVLDPGTTDGSVKNTSEIEFYLNPMYAITPDLKVGAGYGYASLKNDVINSGNSATMTEYAYFINATYNFNKYFSIMPEFTYRDFGKDYTGTKLGHEYYAGAQLQCKI